MGRWPGRLVLVQGRVLQLRAKSATLLADFLRPGFYAGPRPLADGDSIPQASKRKMPNRYLKFNQVKYAVVAVSAY